MHRICIFSLAYYPNFVSGAEAAIHEITARLEGYDCHLITLQFDRDAPRREEIGGVTVHRVGFGGNYLSKMCFIPLAAWKARSLHREQPFDAMWCVLTYMVIPVVFAKWLGVRVPHVLTLQDGDPYEKVFQRWFIRPVVPIIDHGIKTATVIQTISEYLADWPRRRDYEGPIEMIHNGANPRDIRPEVSDQAVRDLRAQLQQRTDDVLVVNTARLEHQKGFDTTIRALPELPEHVRLVIVGGGSQEAELQQLAERCGVSDRVVFIGKVDRSEVTKYRLACDVFVGPSRSEGLGNAFLSAMASRLPVVTTREGGLAEFVFGEQSEEHAQTAWVVEPDAPDQIVAAVNDILENPEKVRQVTETAREMVVSEYDWDAIAEKMHEQVFTRAIPKSN